MSVATLPGLNDDALAVSTVLALIACAFVFRRLWLRLLGPVFVYEADRLARRGRTFLLRAIYVLALLVVIYITYPRVQVMTFHGGSDDEESVIASFSGRPPGNTASVQAVMSRFA